ncbi:hypothetical protein ONZ45_g19031 [Pleurotus djamor]|nr:hypothetical protein ONZ45_g19031 [Pleurotus djamor]
MKSVASGALTDHDTRIKVFNGLTVLELLLSSNLNETFPSNASLTWKALSTRFSALQTAVSVLVDLDDKLRFGTNVSGSVGQRYRERLTAGEEDTAHGGDDSEDLSSVVEAASVINRTLHDKSAIHADESTQSTSLCFTKSDAKPSPVASPGVSFPATAPLQTVQPIESSIRLLSHQLSEFSSTLLVECNRTKIELAAECNRSHKLELERDDAVMKKNELERQIQDAERARDELVKDNEDFLSQLQKSCLGKDMVVSEKVTLRTQLDQAISQSSAVIKERDDLLARLAHTTSTMNLMVIKKDKLSKRLDEVISQNEALVVDNKVLVDRTGKAYLQKDAALKIVDDLKNQAQELTEQKGSLTREREETLERLRTVNEQLFAVQATRDSALQQNASLEAELRQLKANEVFMTSEIYEAQPGRLRDWASILEEFAYSKGSIARTDIPYINKILKSIQTYSHHVSVTYQCLQESKIFTTLRFISTLHTSSAFQHNEYKLIERAKAIVKQWQIVWDEGES